MKPSLLRRGEIALIFDNIIEKALNILSQQFSLEVKYIEKHNISKNDLYQLCIIDNRLLTYTVNFSGIFEGLLELHFNENLNIKQMRKVESILSLFIKSPVQYIERSLLLKELENYLLSQKKVNSNKIININDFKKSKNKIETNDDISLVKLLKSHPPIFIEGNNNEDVNKLAIELHYFLGYKSFVNFKDISANINSYKDLLELKTCSIFISDMDKLSHDEKLIFLDYFTEPNITEHPLIISSSETPYAFLLRDTLNRTLLKFLSTYHIRLNKPLDEIKKDGFTTFLNSILKDPKHFFTTH